MAREQVLDLVAGLADPSHRWERAHTLATYLGGTDLLIFVADGELGLHLPAPGFPQTLPHGRVWRDFVSACDDEHEQVGMLPFPERGTRQPATGVASSDGTVLVVLGGPVRSDAVEDVCRLLPLFAAAVRGEQAAHAAEADAELAQKAAAESQVLNAALDAARTDLQRALTEAAASAARANKHATELQTIIEAIPDSIVVCNAAGEIVQANAPGLALMRADARVPQPLEEFAQSVQLRTESGELVPPSDYPLARALRGITRTDYRFTRRQGERPTETHLLISAAPIRAAAGETTGAVAVITDVTEMYRLERQKEEFLNIASHELRTPLTTLKALTQIMGRRMTRAGGTEAKQAERIEQAIRRMERLVTDLLDVTRVQMGKLDLRREASDLPSVILETIQDQQITWPRRRITVEMPATLPPVAIDDGRIAQVVTNYLTNALKYSRDDTVVGVRVRVEGKRIRVEVRDQGPGLPAEERERVWERFHRAAEVTVQSGSGVGLGLGLYICRAIVEQHGGQVGVESVVGQGSTFWFTLPLAN